MTSNVRNNQPQTVEGKAPNPADIHVGARVRMRRKFLGLSQEGLGNQIGLTFQQVQKYERGTNRISASKLFDISRILEVPVAYFFEGIELPMTDNQIAGLTNEQAAHGFLRSAEGIELAAAFPRIQSAKQRRKVLELVRALAEIE